MSTEKRGPGRPKKVDPKLIKNHKGIVDKPENDDVSFEIIIYEPSLFKKYLKTFKSKKCEEVYMYALMDRLSIISYIQEEQTEHKIINVPNTKKEKVHIECLGVNAHSFYNEKNIKITIQSMDSLDNMIEDITGGTNFLKLYVSKNIDNSLYFTVDNEKLGVTLGYHIEVVIDNQSENISIPVITEEPKLIMAGYRTEDLKVILNKKYITNANKCNLRAINNNITLDMLKGNEKITQIKLRSNNKHLIQQSDPNSILITPFPKKSIYPFLIHIRDIIKFYFTENYIKVINSSLSISMDLVIPINK